MEPAKYLHVILEAEDGTLFAVLGSGPGWELRGRRSGDRLKVETWRLGDSIEVSAEAASTLHILAEQRLPKDGGP